MNTLDLQKKRAKEVHNEAAKLRNNNAFAPAVDVCYILDCTGSMGPYISNAKNTIFDVNPESKRRNYSKRKEKSSHCTSKCVYYMFYLYLYLYGEEDQDISR